MREILFRGKQNYNGEWITGYLVDSYCIGNWLLCEPVITETVGQYTGLTDKNGKKIFEGDIVTGLFSFGMEVKAVVAFQDGAFGLRWSRGGAEQFSAFASICNIEFQVIGNVHDNPELLEEVSEYGK